MQDLIQVGTKHPLIKGIQAYFHKGPRPFQLTNKGKYQNYYGNF